MTIDAIKKTIEEWDRILRPWVVIMNPEDAKLLREGLPDLDERVVVQESVAVNRGKFYLIERKKFDEWTWGGLTCTQVI